MCMHTQQLERDDTGVADALEKGAQFGHLDGHIHIYRPRCVRPNEPASLKRIINQEWARTLQLD